MTAKKIDILGRCFPGAWSVNGDEIISHSGEPIPTEEEIEAKREETEAMMARENMGEKSRQKSRAALREKWDALPAFIRGPFRKEFEAANVLLDEGDDEAAGALVRYADHPRGYSAAQAMAFSQVKNQLAEAIEALPAKG